MIRFWIPYLGRMSYKMGDSILTIKTILDCHNSGEMAEIKLRVQPTEEINFATEVNAACSDRDWNS